MSFRISQTEEASTGNTILLLSGSITHETADLLETICRDLLEHQHASIIINVSDVTFISDYGAKTLCTPKRTQRISLAGLELFTQQMVETTDKSFVTNRRILS